MEPTPRHAIDWFEIPVRDMKRAQAFYESLVATTIRFLDQSLFALRYPYDLDYGEGIVWQQMLMIPGGQMYGDITRFPYIVFHYPPVFHLAVRVVAELGLDGLVAGRIVSIDHLMDAATSAVQLTDQALRTAEDDATAAARLADASVVTASMVGERAAGVAALVAQAQAQLDQLSARARQMAEAQRAAEELARTVAEAAAAAGIGSVRAQLPPAAYFALYQAAAPTCPGMSWTLLAAVGQVESGHGRNNGPSSAGAIGPMQFMPRTFAGYAVDGDRDGRTDPWSPADAVFTAAKFLCSNGAGRPGGLQRALLRYNNAQWYVDLVLGVQASIEAAGV